MNLIYTSFLGKNKNGFSNFPTKEAWLNSLLCSVVCTNSKNQFDKVKLYCDAETLRHIEEDRRHFPFTEIHECNNKFEWLHTINWAYPKVWVYAQQDEPFMHIDTDAFFLFGVPQKVFEKRFFFQSFEDTCSNHAGYFGWYRDMLYEASYKKLLPEIIDGSEYPIAVNMGLFVVNNVEDLAIVKKYHDIVLEYIKNQQVTELYHKGMQSCLFEQFFISLLLDKMGLKKGVDFDSLLSDKEKLTDAPNAYNYVHFIGNAKSYPKELERIKKVLKYKGYKSS